MPFRSRLEHRTHGALDRLNRVPRPVPFAVVLALLTLGVFLPRLGFLATGVVALFVGFLVYYTWPRLTQPEKMMRLAVLVLVVALTLLQAFPRT